MVEITLVWVRGIKIDLFFERGSTLTWLQWVEINLVSVRGIEIDLVWISKLTCFLCGGRNWLCCCVRAETLFGVVLFRNQVPPGPDTPGIILLYDVLYTWNVFIHTECCCRCCRCCSVRICYCSSSCAGWKKLCWFVESDSIQCFLSLHSNTIHF